MNSFILNKTFFFGEEGEISGTHIPKRAVKTGRKVVYFLSVPNEPYIVQTVYFQVTTVY